MKVLWCWRCKMDIPMLDEAEFAIVSDLLKKGTRPTMWFRIKHRLPLGKIGAHERFQPALKKYEQLTGFHETNEVALWHHRISIYGSPCAQCGKILRTSNKTYLS